MNNKSILYTIIVTVIILLIPLIAMQFTDEVSWTLFDFIVAAVLLLGTGFVYEFVSRRSGAMAYRAAVGIAVGTALILVWMNLAVGIIGNESNSANLLYGGVIIVGLIGAVLARLKPRGMSHTLFAMAISQALVPVLGLIIWKPQVTSWGVAGLLGVFILNTIFVVLWIGSALLFRRGAGNNS